MKRIKSIWMRLIVIVISVAMMLGCLGSIVFADTVNAAEAMYAELHDKAPVQSKVVLNDYFAIPGVSQGVDVVVKGPDGKDVDAEVGGEHNGEYHAVSLGNYTVTYSKGSINYTYIINCYEKAEYFITVAHNGATIPTYIQNDTPFNLPEWYLSTYNDDGDVVPVDEEEVETFWSLNGAARGEEANDEIIFGVNGNQIITLSARIKGSKKTYSKDFTVISQSVFNDGADPILRNISNMPSSASRNTKVTLPVATAEDDCDENVLVTVTVTDPKGNDVVEVDVDETYGYAISEKEDAKAVEFDNDKKMSFYPTMDGVYVVKYQAIDDSGRKSSMHSYRITVSDRTGPIIANIEDDKIPTKWGFKSVEGKNGPLDDDQLDIKIYLPEVVDNCDDFILDTGDKPYSGEIKMTVEVKNPNNITVARWATKKPEQFADGLTINAEDDVYGQYFNEDAEGVKIVTASGDPYLRLNFGDFSEKAVVEGDWTISFSFRDAANNGGYNSSAKTYNITVSDDTYIDDKDPVIEEISLPDYIIIGEEDETYTVPYVNVSDIGGDTRLTETYVLYNSDQAALPDFDPFKDGEFFVKGGDVLKIINEDGSYYLQNEDDQTLELKDAGKLYFAFSATDDALNTAYLKTVNEEGKEVDYSLSIYIASDGFQVDQLNFNITDKSLTSVTTDSQYVGGFVINDIPQREFVGYELAIRDQNGESVNRFTSYVFFTEKNETLALNVKDISFIPSEGGEYEVVIRILDAKGNSYVYIKKIDVESKNPTTTISMNKATAWDNAGTTRKSYAFERKPFVVENDENKDFIRVFKIVGGRYSLLGYNFTPIDQGYYRVTEFYGDQTEIENAGELEIENYLIANNQYTMTATDVETTKIEILEDIPSYISEDDMTTKPGNRDKYEEGAFRFIGPVVAYSENQNYDVTVSYTDPENKTYTANKVYEKIDGDTVAYDFKEDEEGEYKFYGKYAIPFNMNGKYTITASANDVSGYTLATIIVGDNKGPQFTLDTTELSAKTGDEFSFRTISGVVFEGSDAADNITVVYKLTDPTGSNVAVATSEKNLSDLEEKSEGVYTINLTESYKFTSSGNYTVEITLKDKIGNPTTHKYTIHVISATVDTPASLTMLSTILIIVGVLLIIGVIVYLIRFRKRRA